MNFKIKRKDVINDAGGFIFGTCIAAESFMCATIYTLFFFFLKEESYLLLIVSLCFFDIMNKGVEH